MLFRVWFPTIEMQHKLSLLVLLFHIYLSNNMLYIIPFPRTGKQLYNLTQESPGSGVGQTLGLSHSYKLTWTFETTSI